jgi:hypothetical protein
MEYLKICKSLSKLDLKSEAYKEEKEKYDNLRILLNLIKSGVLVKNEVSKEKIKMFIEEGHNYKLVASNFNVSENSVRNIVSKACKKFEGVVGEDCIERILEGSFKIRELKSSDKGVWQIVLSDNLKYMKADDKISLKDCMYELEMLRSISKNGLAKLLKNLDHKKVCYIIFILQSKNIIYLPQRCLIEHYFENPKMSIDEVLEKLKDLEKK